ncbi:hypothetical protein R6Q57_013854 [Mikania cordata]
MNPRPNNPNHEFNPFSYDPKSLRNLYAQLQQNLNFQHFQPNFQPPPNFQPGLLSSPNLGSNLILCHRVNLKTRSCRRQRHAKTQKSYCANNRKSGMSDENVLKWAEKEYQLKSNGQTFNHYHVWVAIKDSPKFRVLCQEGYEVQEKQAEFDTPPEPVRPTGRDTTKRASSSSRQTGYSKPTTTEFADQLQAFTAFQKQKHEDRKKMHEEKSLRADLRAMELCLPNCSTTKIVK